MNKRPIFALALAASVSLALSGCVFVPFSGPRITQDRDIDDAHALVLKTDGDVVITLGDAPSLTITAASAMMDRLTSEVDEGVLTLDVRGMHMGMGDIDYALTVTSMSDVTIKGSGDVVADFTGADDITVSIEGSGDIRGTGIDASTVRSSIEGSGDIELTGRADEHTLEIDGSGNFDGQDFETQRARVSISGSGDIQVNVTEKLEAEISGSGEIRYTGGATVSSQVSGSGSVIEDD